MRKTKLRIALINVLGDFGITTYTYELAEGLAAHGVVVDVFSNDKNVIETSNLPKNHCLFAILGSSLIKNWRHNFTSCKVSVLTNNNGDEKNSKARPKIAIKTNFIQKSFKLLRELVLPVELAFYLKIRRYDFVWTQWPEMESYGTRFWKLCRLMRLRIIHTVHNILPHEETVAAERVCKRVYENSDYLIVHSQQSLAELVKFYPGAASKAIVAPHGSYSIYHRMPEIREHIRKELNIAPHEIVWLFFGGIRPYKNLDAVLYALKDLEAYHPVLIVSGVESGYENMVRGEPLGRTARLAEQIGVTHRLRLLPGHCDLARTAELFEAADVVPLPYLKGYGSGVLMLAMTFGNFIVASRTGGMEEYLIKYAAHTLLDDTSIKEVTRGLQVATKAVRNLPRPSGPPIDFNWKIIAGKLLTQLRQNQDPFRVSF